MATSTEKILAAISVCTLPLNGKEQISTFLAMRLPDIRSRTRPLGPVL